MLAICASLLPFYVTPHAYANNTLNAACQIGSSSTCPAQSPQEIVNLYGTTANGAYWINVNGVARETFLILNTSYPDSGGWFLGMKGTRSGSSFWYNSTQWTNQTTTLNTNSLSDDVSTEAKFDAFNNLPATRVVAVFKDRASNAFNANGSGDLGTNSFGGHTWSENVTSTTMFSRFTTNSNLHDASGYSGRFTIHRETNDSNGKLVFPYQTGWTRYGFNNTLGKSYRWGVTSNNESSMGSNDSVSGIGLEANSASAIVSYSDNLTVGPNGTSGATNPGTFNYPSGFQIWGKMANPSIAAPATLTRTNPGDASIRLNIGAVAAATEYAVQYKLSATPNWSGATTLRLTSPNASTPSASITGLATGTYDFRVWSRATNNSSATARSLLNEPVDLTPTNTVIPAISGTTTYLQSLSASTGTWSNSPTSYTYKWSRASTSGGTYANISGATTSTYTLASADVGQFLKVTVTATNSTGSTSAVSSASTQISKANQTITLSTLGTSSKTFPYSQELSMSTSGSVGSGAITYAISVGGTATGCALSNSTSSATISATTSGTCLVAATIATDSNYNGATSSALTFTFNRAAQSALSITSTDGSFGTPLTLTTSGGTGDGSVTYSYAAGTTTCTISGSTLTADASGTCLITATKAADSDYSAISSIQTTITFAVGSTTATVSIAAGELIFRQSKAITAVASVAGKLTFRANRVIIPGCKNLNVKAANSFTRACSYRPSTRGYVTVTVTFTPTNNSFGSAVVDTERFFVNQRSGRR